MSGHTKRMTARWPAPWLQLPESQRTRLRGAADNFTDEGLVERWERVGARLQREDVRAFGCICDELGIAHTANAWRELAARLVGEDRGELALVTIASHLYLDRRGR